MPEPHPAAAFATSSEVAPPTSPTPLAFVVERFSPTRFDTERVVTDREVELLLDAARNAPSAGNSQPWAFIVGRRGDPVHRALTTHLARSSAAWAPDASLLVANLVQVLVEDSDMEYSEFAFYDLGQAVAHLTFQAHALGMQVHQFRAFDRDGIHRGFGVPPHWTVATMAAIGAPHAQAPHRTGGSTSGQRHPLARIIWSAT